MLPQRKSPRAKWIAYDTGMYHITVCVKNQRPAFGKIDNFKMLYTTLGKYLHDELTYPERHHPNITIPVFQVMPNHFHAIVCINRGKTADLSPTDDYFKQRMVCECRRNTALSRYVAALKASVTRFAHTNGIEFEWQSRYNDHAIRGVSDGNRIEAYIRNNVANWTLDKYNL